MINQEISELLHSRICGRRTAFLCIGNMLCSDDAAGMRIGELIRSAAAAGGYLVCQCSTAPENFTGELRSFAPESVILIDAAHMTRAPGTVFVIPEGDIKGASFSTHMLPLNILTDYIRQEICSETAVIGIQPVSCEAGTGMCAGVEQAVRELSAEIIRAMSAAE